MADAYQCLDSFRKLLIRQREELKEKLARGLGDTSHHEMVGRCKALADAIDKLNAQIKSLNGGDGDESDGTR